MRNDLDVLVDTDQTIRVSKCRRREERNCQLDYAGDSEVKLEGVSRKVEEAAEA